MHWRWKEKNGQSLQNRKPGPVAPVHKLLPEERITVLQMAKKEEYADLSHRILTVTAWDLGLFFVSFSSVYRILCSASMMAMRGIHRQHNGRSIPNENIFDLPEDQRPEVINDRGRQMKAKSIKRMFKDHYMPQLFARPRTPNDNPFVESLFGTIKRAPEYPGRFLDREEAVEYFNRYFPWYTKEHLHSGIDYVTPEQCHKGLKESIVSRRKENLKRQRYLRKEVNRLYQNTLTCNPENLIVNVNQFTACGVMIS